MEFITPLAIIFILFLIPFIGGKPKKKGSIDPIKSVKGLKL